MEREIFEDEQEARISSFWGVRDMQQQLQEAMPQDWLRPPALASLQWMGAFTQFEVLVAARACLDSGSR